MNFDYSDISVAIPFYSGEEYLLKALRSISQQTMAASEVIISLDSPLTSEILIRIKALSLPNLKLITNPSPGIANNWNHCVKSASGRYITLLHSDDELNVSYIARMQEEIVHNSACEIFYTDAEVIGEDSEPEFSFADFVKSFLKPRGKQVEVKGDTGLASLLRGCFIFCPSITYKRELLLQFPFDAKWEMVLDLDLYQRLLFRGKSFYAINEKLYRYRRHTSSQTGILTQSQKRFYEESALYDKIGALSEKRGWAESAKVAKQKRILKLHVHYLMVKNALQFNLQMVTRLKRLLNTL